ncbi:Nucleolar protein 6 [Aix galericulata]|nr:Nucleolar protein 6 [Aix galericulata]
MQIVFCSPLDLYSVLIHLNYNQIPQHLESVDCPVKSFSQGVVKNSVGVNVLFPVVDYDPVQCYLQELRPEVSLILVLLVVEAGATVVLVEIPRPPERELPGVDS